MAMLERLRRLLPGLWAGLLLCIAAIAAPAVFALLERSDAGRLVGRIFMQEAWLSLALGVLLLVVERARARAAAESGAGSVLSTEVLLVLGTLFCTVAGYFALQPLVDAARAGTGPLTFGQLHAVSVAFFMAKWLLLMALAWRTAKPSNLSRPPSS